ncbi:hypothetical protein [Sphaerobacter thermophilus]|uniref:hypothetical protein n=1 Tax=Sphaerobacter thermophilus TaxID=2057 RepID=UPI0039C0A9BA
MSTANLPTSRWRVMDDAPYEDGEPVSWYLVKISDPSNPHMTMISGTPDQAQGVTAVDVGAPTHHTVASVFWEFMNSRGTLYDEAADQYVDDRLWANPFYATGYPITDAYWINTWVAGEYTRVLVQCFERRCLTYTPSNPDGRKVEMGNIGQHYYYWRYGEKPWEAVTDPNG